MPGSSSPSSLILLAGPTASGKTSLAVDLAQVLHGEIISADSMQIYRGCAIGTAQPSPQELRGTPCHLVGCRHPWEPWSVADWLRAAQDRIQDIQGRGRTAIVAGGTGLYFKALSDGLFEAPGAGRNAPLRSELEAAWDADGGRDLYAQLSQIDPVAAKHIHIHDRLRIVRALEVFHASGRPLSALQAEGRRKHTRPKACRLVLSMDRADLYHRIDQRVEAMMSQGFMEEVRALMASGATEHWPAMRALGYPQMLQAVRGEITRAEAIAQTQQASRRYAKQQLVLLRPWRGAVWIDAGRAQDARRAAEIVLEFSRMGNV